MFNRAVEQVVEKDTEQDFKRDIHLVVEHGSWTLKGFWTGYSTGFWKGKFNRALNGMSDSTFSCRFADRKYSLLNFKIQPSSLWYQKSVP